MSEAKCTPQLRAQDIGWKIQVTVLTTWIPLLFIVVARVVTRWRNRTKFGLDDFFMLAALIPISLGSIFHLVGASYGLGKHIGCLDLHNLSQTIKFQYLGEGMNILSIWLVKLSICFFLLRIIERTHRNARIFIWTLIVVNTILQLFAFVVCWASTKTPIWAWWDFTVKPNNDFTWCITYDRVVFVVNVVIDFIFAFSPIYFLRNIRIAKSQKYNLFALMSIALLPSIAGIFKVVYLTAVINTTDPTYVPIKADDIAALVEQNAGAFVVNLPCIKPLLESIATALSESYSALVSRVSPRRRVHGSLESGEFSDHTDYVGMDRIRAGKVG